MKLNSSEQKVFDAVLRSADGNGYDFGFTDEVRVEGLTEHQIGGYLTQLERKGLISIDEPCYGTGERLVQICITDRGFELAGLPEEKRGY